MKLKRLIVQGFKSFKDKTVINFEDGITGIVGPNGCGKSNIVDALFWVMGEQSAKHLRGSSMKDVIFSGSEKYSPASWAEVSLVLGNEEGKHIHIGDKIARPVEIQLTRKLYRNGESEYRINNIPGRLKDIQEIFMDTGAGAKSYSVIAQGEISRLVQAKPQERRQIIEEVAGITKFKLRKKESLKKIELTQTNLNRLSDLKSEVQKNLSILEKQAQKAEKARVIKEKIKDSELIVSSHKEYEILKDFRDGKNWEQQKTLDLESKNIHINNLELNLERERTHKLDLIEKVDLHQKEFGELSKNLAASEERFTYLIRTKKERIATIDQRLQESKDFEKDIAEGLQRVEILKGETVEFQDQQLNQDDFDDLEERVESLSEEIEMNEQISHELKAKIQSEQDKLKSIEHEWVKNSAKADEMANNLQQITLDIDKLEKENGHLEQELQVKRVVGEQAKNKVEELSGKNGQLKEEIVVLKGNLKVLEDEFNQKSKENITNESRLISLKEIRDSGQDGHEGNLGFLKSAKSSQYKILGNLIECDEIYAQGMQNLLDNWLKSLVMPGVVTGDGDSFEEIFNYHQKNKEKGLGFSYFKEEVFVDEQQTMKSLSELNLGEIIPCREVVRILDTNYKNEIEEILKGSFLVSQLDPGQIEKISANISFRGLVTFDGKTTIQKENGVFFVKIPGTADEGKGEIIRNNLIAEMSKKSVLLKGEIDKLEGQIKELNSGLQQKIEESELNFQLISEVKTELAANKSFVETKEASFMSYKAKLEELRSKKVEISKTRLILLESEEQISTRMEELKANLEDQTEQLQTVVEKLEELKESYNDQREELIRKQSDAKNIAYMQDRNQKLILELEQQIHKQKAKLLSNETLILEMKKEVETLTVDITQLEVANKNLSETLARKEIQLAQVKDQLGQKLMEIEKIEKQVHALVQVVNGLEKELALKKVKLEQLVNEEDQLVRNIIEKYRVNLRNLVGGYLSYQPAEFEYFVDLSSSLGALTLEDREVERERMSFTFIKKETRELNDISGKLKKLKNEFSELGEINWSAIEEFERHQKRFDFLKAQEEELLKSLENLQTAIMHIDEKSKQKFYEAYAEVNMRFEKVFPILFGGGSARLQIVEEVDNPESGVDIIAQPPGKKMQNINLMSGGEKAMTAVSLIFSIFLVKPSPFCLLDEVDAPLDDANVGRFNELLREMSLNSQFILITHNKKTMELNDVLYGVTMQEPGVSKAVSVQLH